MQKDPTQRFRHSYSQKKDVVLLGDPFLGRVAQSTPCFLTCAKLWWFLCFSFFLFKLIYVSPLFSVFSICKFFGTSVWTYDINWHQLTLTSVDLSHGTWLHQGRNSFPPLPPESVSIGRQPIRRSLWSRGLKGSAAKLCRLNAFFQVLDVMCFWCWVTRVKYWASLISAWFLPIRRQFLALCWVSDFVRETFVRPGILLNFVMHCQGRGCIFGVSLVVQNTTFWQRPAALQDLFLRDASISQLVALLVQ